MQLVGAELLDADAYFPCGHAAGAAFVVLDAPDVRADDRISILRAFEAVQAAAVGMPMTLSRRGVARFADRIGLEVEESADTIFLTDGESRITLTIDGLGRVTQVDASFDRRDEQVSNAR